MSKRPTLIDDRLYEYLLSASLREHPTLRRLRDETARHPRANMQISPDQGQFLQLLVQMIGARKTIEVGVFTGYSSLAVALALPAEGRIVACDINEDYTSLARRAWTEAGVAEKIDLRIAPATETLQGLVAEGRAGTFDFAFIDADKASYDSYCELCIQLLRPGGVLAFDNTLWDGKVADPTVNDDDTRALRALNAKLHRDERVDLAMLTVADGLTLARKR